MKSKRWILFAVVLALLAAPACSVLNWLEDQGLLEGLDALGQNTPTELPVQAFPTLYPTVTPRAPIATNEPSAEAPPPATAQPITIAPTEDGRFRLELSEAELAAIVGEGGLAQQGLRVNDVAVRVTEQHVIATFNAAHADTGLSGEITMVAVPQVVNGELYLRIVDYSLGTGFSGFARLIASALIKAAIDSYNTANGIPIPLGGGAEVTSVELFPGKLVINGVYR